MNAYLKAMMAAALLVASGARADEAVAPAGDAIQDRDRLRDGTGDGVPDRLREHADEAIEDRDRLREHAGDGQAVSDPLRERARQRMHEALAEHAPQVPPAEAGTGPVPGTAVRERARDRDQARDEMATRAARRNAERAGAGAAGEGRGPGEGGGHHGEMGGGHGTGMGPGSGDCTEAARQRRVTEMHGGTSDGGMHHGR
jgi:hypothetical protein